MALALTRGGYADTDVRFAEFFGAEHTVACHFLLQHPHACAGPMLTVNGRGTYAVGQQDCDVSGGQPALEVRIGTERLVHPLPEGTPTWHHLALVRTAGEGGSVIRLFVDGKPSGKPSGGPLTVSRTGLPQGTLRLGKTVVDPDLDGGGAQLYGLLDDVAVFRRALSDAEVARLAGARRLSGRESGLLAGFTFGERPRGDMPAALQRLLLRTPAAMIRRVSVDRDGARGATGARWSTPWAPLPTATASRAGTRMGKTAAVAAPRRD